MFPSGSGMMRWSRAEGFPDILIVEGSRHEDARGTFSEVWRDDMLRDAGVDISWVQENHVWSTQAGTVRGMHAQVGKAAQAKLLRCLRGRLLDVAVDVRKDSPTYGRAFVLELSAQHVQQLFLPIGYAHGYCTLEENTELLYKVSTYYDPALEWGFFWNDPAVAIPWPRLPVPYVLSPRDAQLRCLAQVSPFDG